MSLEAYRAVQQVIEHGRSIDGLLQRLQPIQPTRTVTPEDAQQIRERYQQWYQEALSVLPDDLRRAFTEQYEGDPLVQPGIKHYLEHFAEPNPKYVQPEPGQPYRHHVRWKYSYSGSSYQRRLQRQQEILDTARARILDIPTPFPHELRTLLGAMFSGKGHNSMSIDLLFTESGAQKEWWIQPRTRTGNDRTNHVNGWLDGLMLYAPDRAVSLIISFGRLLMSKGYGTSANGQRLQQLIDEMKQQGRPLPTGTAGPPSAPITNNRPYIDPERIAGLRALPRAAFDLSRIIRFCEEINAVSAAGCHHATILLVRALIYSIPPIFGAARIVDVLASPTLAPAVRESMSHLEHTSRRMAEVHLGVISQGDEVLPSRVQADFSHDLDVLLGEIARVLARNA